MARTESLSRYSQRTGLQGFNARLTSAGAIAPVIIRESIGPRLLSQYLQAIVDSAVLGGATPHFDVPSAVDDRKAGSIFALIDALLGTMSSGGGFTPTYHIYGF